MYGVNAMRISWDEYFMSIAQIVALRSSCSRKKVGAVLVKGKKILGTGYNGAPADIDNCLEIGCLMRNSGCVRAIHAEINVILQTDNQDRQGATLYTTTRPCWSCANTIANSGITEVVYAEDYRIDFDIVIRLFEEKNIKLRQYNNIYEVAYVKKEDNPQEFMD